MYGLLFNKEVTVTCKAAQFQAGAPTQDSVPDHFIHKGVEEGGDGDQLFCFKGNLLFIHLYVIQDPATIHTQDQRTQGTSTQGQPCLHGRILDMEVWHCVVVKLEKSILSDDQIQVYSIKKGAFHNG